MYEFLLFFLVVKLLNTAAQLLQHLEVTPLLKLFIGLLFVLQLRSLLQNRQRVEECHRLHDSIVITVIAAAAGISVIMHETHCVFRCYTTVEVRTTIGGRRIGGRGG